MNELYHYGMPRRSGRYPYGSGKDPFQHNGPNILDKADALKRKHPDWSNTKLANELSDLVGTKITRDDYEAMYSIRKDEQYAKMRAKAYDMKNNVDKQYSYRQIAKELGVSEGTIRNMFKDVENKRLKELETNMDVIRQAVKEKTYIDVSEGAAERIGVSPSQLKAAYLRLAANGEISINDIKVPNGDGTTTTALILAPVDAKYADIKNASKTDGIKTIDAYAENNGRTMRNLEPIESISSKRVGVRYAEDGGVDMDGVIQIKRGVEDLSLGKANYAQVRIAVDDTHYLKGMAIYGDKKDFPPGVDIMFNTNKHKGTPMCGPENNTVLKLIKRKKDGSIDEDNPFGATIKTEENRIKCQNKGAKINIVNEEGDWDKWSRKLASQFLSKQSTELVNKQLKYTYDNKKAEFEEIQGLTNPIVKKHLMLKFADSCDSDSVYLKAAALPRQATKVLLPMPKMNPMDVYAPGYKNGEKVVLIRYPHAGQFELPELRVNNNIPYGKKIIGQSKDAIGIHPKTAAQLSGADFDGDTVMLVPKNKRVNIQTKKPLEGLKDFDPKEAYPPIKDAKGNITSTIMSKKYTQKQMGMVSNLITDMTVAGAKPGELARAVRHSMVVIDANKHKLNYKLSEEMNGIAELKKKYQPNGGASTLLSRAKSPDYRNQVLERGFDKTTGERIRIPTGARAKKRLADGTYVDNGPKQTKLPKMAWTNDARTLLSDHPNLKEKAYANYANQMKALANKARLASLDIPPQKYNPSAAKTYSKEVHSLEQKLLAVQKQKPLERRARYIADSILEAEKKDDPTLYDDKDRRKKVYAQALDYGRYRVGKDKTYVEITNREWAAIQAGAIHATKAKKILDKAKPEDVRKLATPKVERGVSSAKEARIKAMLSAGMMTQTEIAEALGVSVSTVRNYV